MFLTDTLVKSEFAKQIIESKTQQNYLNMTGLFSCIAHRPNAVLFHL